MMGSTKVKITWQDKNKDLPEEEAIPAYMIEDYSEIKELLEEKYNAKIKTYAII